MDAFSEYTSDIEDITLLKALAHFNIDLKIVLWDTTSFYFEGDYGDSDLIKLGYSRDQKKEKKQVVFRQLEQCQRALPSWTNHGNP